MDYLDDWLVQARSEHELLALSHVERLGLRISLAKSTLSPSQRVAFLRTVIYATCAHWGQFRCQAD